MPEHAPNVRFAQYFNDAMAEKGVTMKQLSANSDYQYESFRKLSKGITTPSKDMLNFLHKQLGIDVKKAELLIVEDKARRNRVWKFVQQSAGVPADLEPIIRFWGMLSDQDKHELISIAQMKAKFHREGLHEYRRKSG